ncbi:3-hydroxybenzoate 4-monooxygenase [Rhizobium rhizogenes]|uniref:Oxygenase (Tetracycline 6-hydroxylase) protein n=1 Tax=Rhizobium rhizogenes (strain K84 / ATCC BAA-868) TaxID=311403 RepID=B9JM53_RHIR8|nr:MULTISPECIES: FAD-binding monooxygenase [Rhizobium]ACM28767.1 oxygenase (tetracycline 6-hydroxylase) protein [Rhizobium rhizogenes K84]OCJ18969.1 phenol 2-monooxygenase [Agrobacterium sp. B131/95]EJK88063.1 2-polyprenyl-6-methoxyphenol hydroxylase-like oxidoreductase [Rhizobium sp. AP16]NTI24439.1 3-hydroxybenzoate 4-monooxygenase [Rhizobium rhizogenes]NTI43759.1 3-hydroxybenzoate 4-monooxygenase [Rhizobium rhizogenes]
MQFHLNGFRTGDPAISEPLGQHIIADTVSLPDEVDVLIVGCGPAGLTLAAQLAAFPAIKTLIVDQKPGPLELGQADGIACRTMEMFQAFGFAERVMKEGYWVNETAFWKPDEVLRERIVRQGRVQDVEDGLSEFPHLILNQARVHNFFLDVMRQSAAPLEPAYSRRLLDLQTDAGQGTSGHPVTARLERIDPAHEGQIETVKARYLIGCDGARSTVRKSIGRSLRGDSANHAWGVMDVLAVTDFPDIRLKALIQSAGEGSIVLIPREGGYLVRIYVELDKLNENERVANRKLTVEDLIGAVGRILHPYRFEVKEVAWWSVYEIGQRLCDKFDDVPETEVGTRLPHIFIAGDACHTHSPKAGQGMNVSMQDSFNLGWKLAAVLQGRCAPELLHSYSDERQSIAKELIEFDREWAKMLSAPLKSSPEGDGVNPAEIQQYFVRHGRYTAGTATRYAPSRLTGKPTHAHLARGLEIGTRFLSAPVIRLADAKRMHLGHAALADGRWRLYAFAGTEDTAVSGSHLHALCQFLAQSPASPVRKYTPSGSDIDSVIDLRAIFQQSHHELALEDMPALLLPAKGRLDLRDYEKMFCADVRSGDDIFDMRGIDRARGCVIVVRPDQYVAHILPLNAHSELSAFFDGFMIQPSSIGPA